MPAAHARVLAGGGVIPPPRIGLADVMRGTGTRAQGSRGRRHRSSCPGREEWARTVADGTRRKRRARGACLCGLCIAFRVLGNRLIN